MAQERLAMESRLNRGYVGGMERDGQNISLVNLCRIANALRKPPSTLLEWNEDGTRRHPETKATGEGGVLQHFLAGAVGDLVGKLENDASLNGCAAQWARFEAGGELMGPGWVGHGIRVDAGGPGVMYFVGWRCELLFVERPYRRSRLPVHCHALMTLRGGESRVG